MPRRLLLLLGEAQPGGLGLACGNLVGGAGGDASSADAGGHQAGFSAGHYSLRFCPLKDVLLGPRKAPEIIKKFKEKQSKR